MVPSCLSLILSENTFSRYCQPKAKLRPLSLLLLTGSYGLMNSCEQGLLSGLRREKLSRLALENGSRGIVWNGRFHHSMADFK